MRCCLVRDGGCVGMMVPALSGAGASAVTWAKARFFCFCSSCLNTGIRLQRQHFPSRYQEFHDSGTVPTYTCCALLQQCNVARRQQYAQLCGSSDVTCFRRAVTSPTLTAPAERGSSAVHLSASLSSFSCFLPLDFLFNTFLILRSIYGDKFADENFKVRPMPRLTFPIICHPSPCPPRFITPPYTLHNPPLPCAVMDD